MAHNYLFDVKLFASIRVEAESEAAARACLREMFDCACISDYGVAENGVVTYPSEASMDGEADLVEVDGEDPEA